MKVKAKHWLNVGGEWHKAGEEFAVKSIAGIEDSVEVIADTKRVEEPETETVVEEKPAESPKRRGRTSKQ